MEGSTATWRVGISGLSLDPSRLLAEVGDASAGAVILFLGTARNHSPGKAGITHLEYEAYSGVVEEKLTEIVREAIQKWNLVRVVAEHRVGEVTVGEASVAVAVSSAHRDDAFEAGRYIIDELKARAPIWKKEHWPGGGDWVQGA